MPGPFDFTGQNIEDSYQRVLQINDNTVYNGTGSLVNSINVTASFAVSASRAVTASFAQTASLANNAIFAFGADFASDAGTALLAYEPVGDWIPAKPDPNGISPFNLGSPEAAWNHLYVNNGTIFFLSESVGSPTTSGSLSIIDEGELGSRFVLGIRDSSGQQKEVSISDKGASLALTASFVSGSIFTSANTALSASYALNGGVTQIVAGTNVTISPNTGTGVVTISSTPGNGFPFIGDAIITGSLTVTSTSDDIFLIKNQNNKAVLTVSQSGTIMIATQSVTPTGNAPAGAIYFTADSLFIGLA